MAGEVLFETMGNLAHIHRMTIWMMSHLHNSRCRGTAQNLHRQDPEARAAQGGGVDRGD